MTVKAQNRYLRIAPRKVRMVTDMIRRKKAEEAQALLNFTPRSASAPVKKLLDQALANAKNNLQLDPSNLFISKITVDEGPKYKRWEARARGQANEIQKKTSHITLELEEIVKGKAKPKAAAAKTQAKAVAKPTVKKAEPIKAEPKERVEEALSFEGSGEEERKPTIPQPKVKPERKPLRPQITRGLRRVFRRKAF